MIVKVVKILKTINNSAIIKALYRKDIIVDIFNLYIKKKL